MHWKNRGLYTSIMLITATVIACAWGMNGPTALAAEKPATSYAPVDAVVDFAKVVEKMSAEKPKIMERQKALLAERYDLSDKPAKGVTMSRG